VTTKDDLPGSNGSFRPRAEMRVIDESGADVGTGVPGMIAFGGRQPLGYYKDRQKTTEVFRVIDGKRYSVPGDWATINEDGTVTLLGRGSACINTGGEKVYPDEVEKVIGALDGVADVVVLGVPHERFGQAVAALVQPEPGRTLTEAGVIAHTKQHLAGYKAPRQVIFVESVERSATGKIDLRALRDRALAAISNGPDASSGDR
jgi:3-oxocholest-4-en-26-oate---CoA ligase